jgi:hypothetical protein
MKKDPKKALEEQSEKKTSLLTRDLSAPNLNLEGNILKQSLSTRVYSNIVKKPADKPIDA